MTNWNGTAINADPNGNMLSGIFTPLNDALGSTIALGCQWQSGDTVFLRSFWQHHESRNVMVF
jgi:hypothetical protein